MSKGISQPVYYGDLVYKLRRVKDTPNFILSDTKIVKRLRARQYDPLIIDRTIGLVLGPSTTLYRHSLKHCTLTNEAVWTIWRALSKPPQRRQGPDFVPLLVGTHSAIKPELDSRRAEHSLSYSDVTIYFCAIYEFWFGCVLDSFTLRNLCLPSTGSSNMATNLLKFKQRSPRVLLTPLRLSSVSSTLHLLHLHCVLVRSCLLLLKCHFLPFTLVLQIPNLRLFPIKYGLRSPFVSQFTWLTGGFPRFLRAMLGDA